MNAIKKQISAPMDGRMNGWNMCKVCFMNANKRDVLRQ